MEWAVAISFEVWCDIFLFTFTYFDKLHIRILPKIPLYFLSSSELKAIPFLTFHKEVYIFPSVLVFTNVLQM